MAVRKSCLRHARRRQGNAGSEGLCKRRQDNAECDAAYRSPRQVDNLLAALVGQPPSKEPAPVGRHFTLGIKNGGDADRQEKVQHRPSEASGSREKPFRDGLGIGTNQLNDVLRAAFHQAFPFFGNGPTHQWNIGQPRRRRRQTSSRSCRIRQIKKTAGVSSDRADGHRKRNQHEEQQKQRHQRNGGPATTAESRLQPSHEGPCGNHQRGRPHCRRQEGPHNKKRNDNQADNRQDGKRRARQVERFRYHRTLQRWNARSRRATERHLKSRSSAFEWPRLLSPAT